MSAPSDPFGQNPWLAVRRRNVEAELRAAWGRGDNVFMRNPADLAAEHWEEVAAYRDGHADPVLFGIESVDAVVNTLYGDRFCVVMGRPSEGKTLLATQLVRSECEAIAQRAALRGHDWTAERDYVLYVGLEESAATIMRAVTRNVTAMARLRRGELSFDEAHALGVAALDVPLWVIGQRRRDVWGSEFEQAELDGEAIWNEIMVMYNRTGRKPSLIVVDYLQAMGTDADDMRRETARNVVAARDLARQLKTPVVLASQAKRVVDSAAREGLPPIPDTGDSEFSAAAEHKADILLSITRPERWPAKVLDRLDGVYCPKPKAHPERVYKITDKLVLLRLLKQRGAKGRDTFMLEHNVATGELTPARAVNGMVY